MKYKVLDLMKKPQINKYTVEVYSLILRTLFNF